MTRPLSIVMFLALVVGRHGAAVAADDPPTAAPPKATPASSVEAERRAKELAGLLDSGDVAEFKKYATENFAPGFLSIPMERHLDFFRTMVEQTHGVDFHSLQEAKPNNVAALFKSKLTGQWVLLRAAR